MPPARHRVAGDGSIRTDPRLEAQAPGGIADFWYLDDGDSFCDPRLVMPFVQCYDAADARVGGERNIMKTKMLYCTDVDTLEVDAAAWRLDEVRTIATVGTADTAEPTLGVVTGALSHAEEQL